MKQAIPADALQQHIAILGKTGSGKTSTAKLAIEQVVAEGSRVCILDPIKSDWWGLISSANGKSAGLPFRILGGPRGHVPLHDAAGKAIAEVVASGALPHAIIDMADFRPGGQAKFFVDFAPILLRKMRGVLYLVLEEAHLFAPKERSGIGEENMSIHWAKMLATAGRSKGIRLVLLTQRTQSLHNALLGSCDSIIAHRLTAPADQEPVNRWLAANAEKSVATEVAGSLSSLKTGEGWLCSGEARLFERRQFPRIHTYDNTRTPTASDGEHHVKTAPVDASQLKTIIGDAVKEAEANDPKALKTRISALEKELRDRPEATKVEVKTERVEVPVLKNGHLESFEKLITRAAAIGEKLTAKADELKQLVTPAMQPAKMAPAAPRHVPPARPSPVRPAVSPPPGPNNQVDGTSALTGPEQRVLDAIAWFEALSIARPGKTEVGFIAGYRAGKKVGGTYGNILGALRAKGLLEYPGPGVVELTDAGRQLARDPGIEHTSEGIQTAVLARLDGPEQRVLSNLIQAYPEPVSKKDLGSQSGYSVADKVGGTYGNILGRLRSLGLIDYPSTGNAVAKSLLFVE